jgi:hypothetical protein
MPRVDEEPGIGIEIVEPGRVLGNIDSVIERTQVVAGEWRHLFGPEGDAPLYVRNDVDFYDFASPPVPRPRSPHS